MDDEFLKDAPVPPPENPEPAEGDARAECAAAAAATEEGAHHAAAAADPSTRAADDVNDGEEIHVLHVDNDEISVVFEKIVPSGPMTAPVKREPSEEGELSDEEDAEPLFLGERRNETATRSQMWRDRTVMKEEMVYASESGAKSPTLFDLALHRSGSRAPHSAGMPQQQIEHRGWETVDDRRASYGMRADDDWRREEERSGRSGARSMVGGASRYDRSAPREEYRRSQTRDVLPNLDGRRTRSRSPHRALASYSTHCNDGRARGSPNRGRRGEYSMSSRAQSMVPDRRDYDQGDTVARSMVGGDYRSNRREQRRSPSRRCSPSRGPGNGAASIIAGSIVAREIQVVRVKQEADSIKREEKKEEGDDVGDGFRRPRTPRRRPVSPRGPHSPRRSSSRRPLFSPPRSSYGEDRGLEVVGETNRHRRSFSRASHFSNNNSFANLVANVNKRPGTRDDPLGFDRDAPSEAPRYEPCTIAVHSDEKTAARFRLVMLDPTYGTYPLEAVNVIKNACAAKTYEFEFTPIMYGPHVIILTQGDFFLVHSVRVRGNGPPPQRRQGQDNRPPLPRLAVNGVPDEMAKLFHAPRPRRADEKHVDVRRVLEQLLG